MGIFKKYDMETVNMFDNKGVEANVEEPAVKLETNVMEEAMPKQSQVFSQIQMNPEPAVVNQEPVAQLNNVEQAVNESYSLVPEKKSFWSKFKSFMLTPITIETTPYQKKVFREVSDFWNSEIAYENGEIFLRKPTHLDDEAEINVSL